MIFTAKEQKKIEKSAVDKGISLKSLMENAGTASFQYIIDNFSVNGKKITILCGNGGNGGDSLVIARYLKEAGAHPLVVICCGKPKDINAELMYELALNANVEIIHLSDDINRITDEIKRCSLIIDAVYGIGFHGELSEDISALFSFINESDVTVIAVDIPSGVNATTGEADKNAIKADLTLCFVAKKIAHILKRSLQYCGDCILLDIGIPDECFSEVIPEVEEIDLKLISGMMSKRSEVSHKGNF